MPDGTPDPRAGSGNQGVPSVVGVGHEESSGGGVGVAVVLAGTVGAAGCGSSGTASPAPPLVLTQGDGCGEVYFWAATDDGDVVVTVYVDVRARSGTEPSRLDVAVPEEAAVEVEVLRGDDLPRNLCTDVIDMRHEPTSTQGVTAGTATIRIEPQGACGSTGGELTLDGLVAEDGTTFEPIRVRSAHVGCYSG